MNHIGRVLVAGASGATGRELLQELSGRDIVIRALTSSAEKRELLEGIGADEVVIGDLLDSEDADRVVEGVDAILCAVGSGPREWLTSRHLVDGTGIINLVDAAANERVRRFAMESAIGVGDSAPGMPAPFRYLLFRSLGAKERAERYLRHSGLRYTILRAGSLTNDPPSGAVLVGEGGDTVDGKIPRADVAHLMVAALYTPAASNRTFEIVSEDEQKGDSRGLVEIDWRTEPGPAIEEDERARVRDSRDPRESQK